ncbi:acyl-CoA dehydrogenase family protein [Actinomadura sp. 7K534]|uniref:acyl-CoA dehydrogenase family protein n=1 Tax=Actinomadura sp. 7K534 TaxID=2530366 RepID=UPI001A9FAE83|nr:acyl-CoA dehydrogenase family protein [Actinomadura sp. 7K534]
MIDAETAELLAHSLRRAFEKGGAASADAALDEVGWCEALAAEGLSVVPLLFAEQGAANAASGALDDLMTAMLGLPPGRSTAFVLPEFGGRAMPGSVRNGDLAVRGLGTARMATAEHAVVVTEEHRAVVVETASLRIRPVEGIDPRLGLAKVDGAGLPAGGARATDAGWTEALAAGRLALASEAAGASRTMLRLAREHAVTRVQFGRPIGSFQAVRHRLAECLVAIEGAEAALAAAVEMADGEWPARVPPVPAAIAKALAGRHARTVARHCQQVLAGVGFTDEHDFHHHFRRVLVLDGLLGDARTLTRELGAELLRTRRLPAVPPL